MGSPLPPHRAPRPSPSLQTLFFTFCSFFVKGIKTNCGVHPALPVPGGQIPDSPQIQTENPQIPAQNLPSKAENEPQIPVNQSAKMWKWEFYFGEGGSEVRGTPPHPDKTLNGKRRKKTNQNRNENQKNNKKKKEKKWPQTGGSGLCPCPGAMLLSQHDPGVALVVRQNLQGTALRGEEKQRWGGAGPPNPGTNPLNSPSQDGAELPQPPWELPHPHPPPLDTPGTVPGTLRPPPGPPWSAQIPLGPSSDHLRMPQPLQVAPAPTELPPSPPDPHPCAGPRWSSCARRGRAPRGRASASRCPRSPCGTSSTRCRCHGGLGGLGGPPGPPRPPKGHPGVPTGTAALQHLGHPKCSRCRRGLGEVWGGP